MAATDVEVGGLIQKPPPSTALAARSHRRLVPVHVWPTYKCEEHGGTGWEVTIMKRRTGGAVLVQFLNTAFANEYIMEHVLQLVPTAAQPSSPTASPQHTSPPVSPAAPPSASPEHSAPPPTIDPDPPPTHTRTCFECDDDGQETLYIDPSDLHTYCVSCWELCYGAPPERASPTVKE